MAPEPTNKLAISHSQKKADNSSVVKSKYWNKDGRPGTAHFDLPLPKKRRTNAPLTSHEPGQMRLRSLPVDGTTTVANKEQYKRKFLDVFDFRPETAPNIKEEPQDEVPTSRPATLTQHFATTKSLQPTATPKVTPLPLKPDEPAESSKKTAAFLSERSAVVATLAYVHDGAVTEAVAALVLRWAREIGTCGQGDTYDAAFIRDILIDLDRKSVV